jgi:hypothetical protein
MNDLNELILEAAAVPNAEIDTDIVLLVKSTDATGLGVEPAPGKNADTIAELLVNAGSEEAALEQRLAATEAWQKKL